MGSQQALECSQRNATRACSCGGMPGRQVCDGAEFLTCECAANGGGAGNGGGVVPSFEGNQRTDITFSWLKTPVMGSTGDCLPGEYEGNFFGIYYSMLAPGGLGVPVTNIDAPGAPSGFHFTVMPAEGGETILKVIGEMNGIADLAFPFKAKIEGELDCKTSTFTAQMIDGTYSVLAEGLLPQYFEGPMSAHYDKRTRTFVDGIWDVAETSAMPPGTLAPTLPRDFMRDGFGGSGKFAAALATDVNDPDVTACPANFTCGAGPLGPNKLLCNGPLGTPTCLTDADCELSFPGEGVLCLNAAAFAICLRECKP
jgi:hypothetical protein